MAIRAGVSFREITPQTPVSLTGYADAKRVATTVHDPLLATALHIRSGSQTMILVSLDLLLLHPHTAQKIRTGVSQAVATSQDLITVCCTHNHSGPATARQLCWLSDPTVPKPDPQYLEFVESQAVRAAAEAAATSQQAEFACVTVESSLNADGTIQPGATILALKTPGGPFIAIGAICDVYPAMLDETTVQVSSDFPHYLRQRLHQRLGDGCGVIHLTGPCADKHIELDPRDHTFDGAEQLGIGLADRIADTLGQIEPDQFDADPLLAGKRENVTLPRQTLPVAINAKIKWGDAQVEYDRIKEAPDIDPVSRHAARLAVASTKGTVLVTQLMQSGKAEDILQDYDPLEVQVLRIGKTALVTLPGMLASHYGRKLRENTEPPAQAICLANGDLQGYVVREQAAHAGSFGPMPGPFGPEAGDLLVETALRLIAAR